MAWALQIWSAVFCRHLDLLPRGIQADITRNVDELGTRLDTWPHDRLQGRSEFKFRVGDFRVHYDFDLVAGKLYLLYLGNRRETYKRT